MDSNKSRKSIGKKKFPNPSLKKPEIESSGQDYAVFPLFFDNFTEPAFLLNSNGEIIHLNLAAKNKFFHDSFLPEAICLSNSIVFNSQKYAVNFKKILNFEKVEPFIIFLNFESCKGMPFEITLFPVSNENENSPCAGCIIKNAKSENIEAADVIHKNPISLITGDIINSLNKNLIDSDKSSSYSSDNSLCEHITELIFDFLWDVNFNDRTVYFSPQFCKKYFTDDGLFKNFTRWWLKLFDPMDSDILNIRLKSYYKGTAGDFSDRICLLKANGNFCSLYIRGKIIERLSNGKPIRIIGTITDFTEIEKAGEAYHRNQLLYHNILDASTDMIAFKSRGFVYLSANKEFSAFFNLRIQDIINKTDFDLFPKEFAIRIRKEDNEVLKTGKKANILVYLDENTFTFGIPNADLSKAAEHRWYEIKSAPVYCERGSIEGIFTVIREITDVIHAQSEVLKINERLESVISDRTSELVLINKELESEIALRKIIEDTMRESKRLLNAIIENVPMAVFLKDINYRYFMVNNYFIKYYPSARGKVIGYTDYEIISPEEAIALRVEDEDVVKKGKTIKYIRSSMIEGIERNYDVVKFPLLDDSGKVYAICGIIHDVTGMTRIKEMIKVSEERLNYALMAANDGLWDWDIKSKKMFFSPRLFEMLGYENNGFIPSVDFVLNRIHENDKELIFAHIEERKILGQNIHVEFRLKVINGEWRWFQVRGQFVEKDEAGNILRVVGTITDISKRKFAEEEMHEAKQHAEMLNRFKDEFITFLSHEMGNTLGLIMLSTEELLSYYENLSETEKKSDWWQCLKIIERSCDNINEFIDDLVEIARIESGKLEIHKCWFDVKELISNVVTNHLKKIEEKPIKIYQEISVGVIYCDEKRIRQVITNFLSNAIRYTDKGSIIITAKKINDIVTFAVEDSGIGISQKDVDRIFEPFFRTENARSVHKGMGIGLTICRKVAEQLGGTVTVTSKPGEGSKFSFTLPVYNENEDGK